MPLKETRLGVISKSAIVFFFSVLLTCPTALQAKNAADACPATASNHAIVTGVTERLELILSDGRILRIAGLEAPGPTPADPDLPARGQEWLKAWLENRDIAFELADSRPDRWGRYAASVFASIAQGDIDFASVGERLLDRGFARVMQDQHKISCEEQMLRVEETARIARRGLWNDPYYAVVEATDGAAFAERAGSFIVATGKLTAVREISPRMMLIFGPNRSSTLAVTILQRNVKIFEAAGLHFRDLIGQTLRVRGMLETRFGPEIELTRPNEIELIAQGRGDTASPVAKNPAGKGP